MTDVTITINVADFTPGMPPVEAEAVIARAVIDTTGTVIVSTAPVSVPLVGGVGTVVLQAGVVYRWDLLGVRGVENSWYSTCVVSMTAAELYRAHQVDPSTLQPTPSYPDLASVIAGLQARVTALESGSTTPPVTSVARVGTAVVGTSKIAA